MNEAMHREASGDVAPAPRQITPDVERDALPNGRVSRALAEVYLAPTGAEASRRLTVR